MEHPRATRRASYANRMYSPGGCSVFVLLFPFLAVGAGIMAAMVGYALLSIAMLIAAIVITVMFARRAPQRQAAGKRLGALVLIPAALYVLSVPYLVFFIWLLFGSFPG